MKKEYISIDDKVIISKDNEILEMKKYNNNIKKIINTENKIDGLKRDIKHTQEQINSAISVVKRLSKVLPFAFLFWTSLLLISYVAGSTVATSIKDCFLIGFLYSSITNITGAVLSFYANQEIKKYKQLLNKQKMELQYNKDFKIELEKINNKYNTKQDNIEVLDLDQLKRYRAKIIAEHHYEINKEKINKLHKKNKLRKNYLIDEIHKEYVYEELESLVNKPKIKVKTINN